MNKKELALLLLCMSSITFAMQKDGYTGEKFPIDRRVDGDWLSSAIEATKGDSKALAETLQIAVLMESESVKKKAEAISQKKDKDPKAKL